MRAQLGVLCVVMRKYNLQYTVYAIHYIPDLLAHDNTFGMTHKYNIATVHNFGISNLFAHFKFICS